LGGNKIGEREGQLPKEKVREEEVHNSSWDDENIDKKHRFLLWGWPSLLVESMGGAVRRWMGLVGNQDMDKTACLMFCWEWDAPTTSLVS
jgi:hypothetical protein